MSNRTNILNVTIKMILRISGEKKPDIIFQEDYLQLITRVFGLLQNNA